MTLNRILALTALSAMVITPAYNSAFAQTAQSDNLSKLKIENFIGRITVKNGDTLNVSGAKDGSFNLIGQTGTISGDEVIKSVNCRERNSRIEISFGNWAWRARSGGYKNIDDYPHLKITLPSDAHLEISDSVIYGDINDLGSADINLAHCGDIVTGDITGELELNISGSADFSAKDIGAAVIKVSGSGDVNLENIGPLSLIITGSGDFESEDIIGDAVITVQGSGDIDINKLTGGLEYKNNGSGDFELDDVKADKMFIRLNGSGDAEIDSGDIDDVTIITRGSGDVSYGGKAVNLDVTARGSSDVRVKKASGDVNVDVSGSSDVYVNRVHYEQD